MIDKKSYNLGTVLVKCNDINRKLVITKRYLDEFGRIKYLTDKGEISEIYLNMNYLVENCIINRIKRKLLLLN